MDELLICKKCNDKSYQKNLGCWTCGVEYNNFEFINKIKINITLSKLIKSLALTIVGAFYLPPCIIAVYKKTDSVNIGFIFLIIIFCFIWFIIFCAISDSKIDKDGCKGEKR